MNKKIQKNLQAGYTLVEAMVYLVIAVFIITYAVKTMNSMTKSYTRHRSVSKVQLNGRDAINIMARQIAGAGFKYVLRYDPKTYDDEGATPPSGKIGSDTMPGSFYHFWPTFDDTPKDKKYAEFIFYEEDYDGPIPGTSTGDASPDNNLDSSSIAYIRRGTVIKRWKDELMLRKLQPNQENNTILSGIELQFRIKGDTLLQITDTLWNYDNGANSGVNPNWAGTWLYSERPSTPNGPDTLILLTGVKVLQYAFSEDGTKWYASLDGPLKAKNVCYIKIGIVIATNRKVGHGENRSFTYSATSYGQARTYAPADSTNGDQFRLHRFYEQIIEVPNNGKFTN